MVFCISSLSVLPFPFSKGASTFLNCKRPLLVQATCLPFLLRDTVKCVSSLAQAPTHTKKKVCTHVWKLLACCWVACLLVANLRVCKLLARCFCFALVHVCSSHCPLVLCPFACVRNAMLPRIQRSVHMTQKILTTGIFAARKRYCIRRSRKRKFYGIIFRDF